MCGISAVCPHVSGSAALVFAIHPEWSNIQVRIKLQETADDLEPPGWDPYYNGTVLYCHFTAQPSNT